MRKVWEADFLSFLIFFFVLLAQYALCDTVEKKPPEKRKAYSVQVRVTIKGSSDAVKEAEVWIRSEEKDEDYDETQVTDQRGAAKFRGVPEGQVFIEVTKRGWRPAYRRYALNSNSQPVQIELQKQTPQTRP